MTEKVDTGKTVLAFGSQALSTNREVLRSIQATISSTKELDWAKDVLQQLPTNLKDLGNDLPNLAQAQAIYHLQILSNWFGADASTDLDSFETLPNVIQTPLCVLHQLASYYNNVKQNNQTFHSLVDTEAVGFCTGLLAAAAVSLSSTPEELVHHASSSLRLAMIIGAAVDAQDAKQGKHVSFSTAWKASSGMDTVKEIVKNHKDSYISVYYDKHRATVTTPTGEMAAIMTELNSVGVATTEIGLSGRFHNPANADIARQLIMFCENNDLFDLPDASKLAIPCRVDTSEDGRYLVSGKLSTIIIESILVDTSQWWSTFKSICYAQEPPSTIATLGFTRCTPPSILAGLSPGITFKHIGNESIKAQDNSATPLENDDDIAIIGLSCRVAGAEDLAGFWDILREGKSQHTEVPTSRFSFETTFRNNEKSRKWYGNFLQDHDAFDHKFFGKTPREAAAMDPQQRQLMQVAYQAIAQSGYFLKPSPSTDVGCYIGTCAVDYEYNVACHKPNAFSSTGNLRGFIAGKVSHYFGLTGPGLTIDTACSGAAVAVHQACKAILTGECETALAGGVNMMTQPLAYQNLAAASFLSQTGQCKPFCESADGYCRGEGITAVFLKKKSKALADGDQIFGVISSTAVQQNQNCTPIFVPNAPSLSTLFRKVLSQARLDPQQVSYVEAHGTGTPVGDPAEYDSVANVFASSKRDVPLQLGSAKGLVGHTESSSGLVSLVKALLMMHEDAILPQASFVKINPHIKTHDTIAISTKLQPWKAPSKAALINNYGASGSNASMVVTAGPPTTTTATKGAEESKHPFWISGEDDRSISDYIRKLLSYLDSKAGDGRSMDIADLSFNLFRQSNRKLKQSVLISASSIDSLRKELSKGTRSTLTPSPPPVVMCFGGQISTYIGLDRNLFDTTAILRKYLDQCDQITKAQGHGSIYPDIFQKSPIATTTKLQLCLFALQFASAKSWIDSNVNPCALVGHSFGELTALCISGVLNLEDLIKMIAGRASVIENQWGPERGSMMAIEADQQQVDDLLKQSSLPDCDSATIACYNGPRSFTLAGSAQAIDAVERTWSGDSAFTGLRAKRLKVTNAFHSTLVEPLKTTLVNVGHTIHFGKPSIPIEFARESAYDGNLDEHYVGNHLRNQVYFSHAVHRLAKKYPSAVWLEIGSNSTITSMASNALGYGKREEHGNSQFHFVAMNITSDNSTNHLTSSTLGLWKAGIDATFWKHNAIQTMTYKPMFLPPYQFDKTRHWMDLLEPPKAQEQRQEVEQTPPGLWIFEGYQDKEQRTVRFRIVTESKKYKDLVSCHNIAHTAPICPATLLVDMAVETVTSLDPDFKTSGRQPQIQHVENLVPICLDSSRTFHFEFSAAANQAKPYNDWTWTVISFSTAKQGSPTVHVTGQVVLSLSNSAHIAAEFARYERLVNHRRCLELLNDDNQSNHIIQGPAIYKVFDEIVQYGSQYHGLQRLVGSSNKRESAGRVVKEYNNSTWLDPHLADCFSQVGGIWVNCMTDRDPGDIYIANGFEKWIRSPKVGTQDLRPGTWHVLACHENRDSNTFVSDIFVFNPTDGSLYEAILGVNYAKVARASMAKILSRLSADLSKNQLSQSNGHLQDSAKSTTDTTTEQTMTNMQAAPKPSTSHSRDVQNRIILILAELSGLDASEIRDDAELADIGIDSLMGMELASELEDAFECQMSMDALAEVISVQGLVQCVLSTLGLEADDVSADDSGHSSVSSGGKSPSTAASSVHPSLPSSLLSESLDSVTQKLGSEKELALPVQDVLDAFSECKWLTDSFIEEYNCQGYMSRVMPTQTDLCIVLTLNAFERLGTNIRTAAPGDSISRVDHVPMISGLVEYLYDMLVRESGLLQPQGDQFVRTSMPAPTATAAEILDMLLQKFPEHSYPHKLTYLAGSKLDEVLSGKSDGIKVIFGSEEGRHLATGLYADSPLNKLSYMQMRDFITRLIQRLPTDGSALKILELGAGTGGTTTWVIPLLEELGVPVEYTFSDLSPSFVAAARKRFGKLNPWMKFAVIDVEKAPSPEYLESFHMILASNAIHATHSLSRSLNNMEKMLRPDGFTMILEMTSTIYWVDMIFGLLEGWWLFDDGRKHAIADQHRWKQDLTAAGFKSINWTDGRHPETAIQRIIIACKAEGNTAGTSAPEAASRQAAIDTYVKKHTSGFNLPKNMGKPSCLNPHTVVLLTGATGSLGSHIVEYLCNSTTAERVICLNRRGNASAYNRQMDALKLKGITLDDTSKVQVLETDSSKPLLGLEQEQYESLVGCVSHIIHNAWPMSGKRPVKGFEAQFKVMRNLIDLAASATICQNRQIGFQFVSSIAVVGHYPLLTKQPSVPEERMLSTDAVLPNGYGDAKWACELMLDATLHQHPERFRPMAVRLGQIAGSRTSGYWNHTEHFTFLIQSSQTLKAFPNLEGTMSWTPVNDVAASLGELLLQEDHPVCPIYHIDSPKGQPWSEMAPVLAAAINAEVIPFDEWVHRVRTYPGPVEPENPAAKLVEFFDQDYRRMSCGGLLLDTSKARQHSKTLKSVGPISAQLAQKYIQAWKDAGVLPQE